VHLFPEAELKALLTKARAKNTSLGVTGMLLYKDGNFIQAVEGPKAHVLDLESAIVADPRHRDVMVLLRGPATARSFADWSMGFRNISNLSPDEAPGFSTLLRSRSLPLAFREEPTKAHKLLLTFRNSM
jgi:hypothetical protein